MLLEPGPLALFRADEIPTYAYWEWLRFAAAEQAAALDGAAGELHGAQLTFAAGSTNELELGPVQDLAAAADEHDQQRRNQDGSIATVAGNADAQAGALAGNAGEVTRDINAGLPSDPEIPPDGYARGGVPPGTPSTEWDAIVSQQVRLRTGNVVTTAQLVYARRFRPDVAALQAWIDAGMPMDDDTPPPPEPEPEPEPGMTDEEWYAAVNDLFRSYAGRDIFDGEFEFIRSWKPDVARVDEWMRAGTPG